MQAPKWEFPIQDIPSQQSGASDGALYLGSLPSRPPAAYSAILPFRPNSMPKGANAVLGFGLGSREPHLTLVLDGEPVLTLTHQHAFFHCVLLLLQVQPLLDLASSHSLEHEFQSACASLTSSARSLQMTCWSCSDIGSQCVPEQPISDAVLDAYRPLRAAALHNHIHHD